MYMFISWKLNSTVSRTEAKTSLSLLVKLSDLLLLANLAKMSLFTHFVAFWRMS